MQNRWIDSHCHLSDELWHDEKDMQALLTALAAQGCEALIQGGVDPEDWERQRRLPSSGPKIIRVFGLHPWTVLSRSEEELEKNLKQLEHFLPDAGGLGEIGVDFVRGPDPIARQKQRDYLAKQLELAAVHQKPCVFHVVRAYPEAWQEVKKTLPPARGMIHSFWASLDKAKPFLDAGWILSPHPRILHFDPHHILEKFPREQLVFESDAPLPRPDGAYSTPMETLAILEHVGEVWQMPLEEVAARQRETLARLFQL